MTDQPTCVGCKYADWKKTANGRLHPSGDGVCIYVRDIPLPKSAPYFLRSRENVSTQTLTVRGGYISRKASPYDRPCPVRRDKTWPQ